MCVAASDETNLWTRPCNEHADDDDDDDEEEEVEEEEVEEGAAAAAAAADHGDDGWMARSSGSSHSSPHSCRPSAVPLRTSFFQSQ